MIGYALPEVVPVLMYCTMELVPSRINPPDEKLACTS